MDATEIGRVNGSRLGSFLERIEDELPVGTVDRTSDWLPIEELEAIY